jgi:2-oxoglutarate dehydrogenase E2 component (dihydrolipoamide succinyltransferase)
MAVELVVPAVGESITEVFVGTWKKTEGDAVAADETVCEIESDKATVDLVAPSAGVIAKILKGEGAKASVGEVIGYIDPTDGRAARKAEKAKEEKRDEKPAREESPARSASIEAAGTPAPAATPSAQPAGDAIARVMPAALRVMEEYGLGPEDIEPTGPGGRITKEDALRALERRPEVAPRPAAAAHIPAGERVDETVPMTPMRRRIAERLVHAQQTAALLTTFNEIDMGEVMAIRRKHRDEFTAKHGVKLGFMSFFVKAVVEALRANPRVNAEIRGEDIVYHHYYDIGIAVGSGKGLVVPVLRNAERMTFAEIETVISDFAARAKENKIKLEELEGGTFTISNGGVYGSLLSAPIVNPPQSGILGLHAIQDRPVAREGLVVIRPMMYVALTYDHRIVDGREAVTFLRAIKESVEQPTRLLLEL